MARWNRFFAPPEWRQFPVFSIKKALHFSTGQAVWARQETARLPAAWPQHRFLTTRKIVSMINGYVCTVVGAASNQAELIYVWEQARPEAKAIIFLLIAFSIIAWSTMFYKAAQM